MHSVARPLDVDTGGEAQRYDEWPAVPAGGWNRQVAAALVEIAATTPDPTTRRTLRRQAAELLLPSDSIRMRRP